MARLGNLNSDLSTTRELVAEGVADEVFEEDELEVEEIVDVGAAVDEEFPCCPLQGRLRSDYCHQICGDLGHTYATAWLLPSESLADLLPSTPPRTAPMTTSTSTPRIMKKVRRRKPKILTGLCPPSFA